VEQLIHNFALYHRSYLQTPR